MVFKSLFLSLINNVYQDDLQKDPTLSVSFILWNIDVTHLPVAVLYIIIIIIMCCVCAVSCVLIVEFLRLIW